MAERSSFVVVANRLPVDEVMVEGDAMTIGDDEEPSALAAAFELPAAASEVSLQVFDEAAAKAVDLSVIVSLVLLVMFAASIPFSLGGGPGASAELEDLTVERV